MHHNAGISRSNTPRYEPSAIPCRSKQNDRCRTTSLIARSKLFLKDLFSSLRALSKRFVMPLRKGAQIATIWLARSTGKKTTKAAAHVCGGYDVGNIMRKSKKERKIVKD